MMFNGTSQKNHLGKGWMGLDGSPCGARCRAHLGIEEADYQTEVSIFFFNRKFQYETKLLLCKDGTKMHNSQSPLWIYILVTDQNQLIISQLNKHCSNIGQSRGCRG